MAGLRSLRPQLRLPTLALVCLVFTLKLTRPSHVVADDGSSGEGGGACAQGGSTEEEWSTRLKGSITDRLVMLCALRAYVGSGAVRGEHVRAFWEASSEVGGSRFSDLFQLQGADTPASAEGEAGERGVYGAWKQPGSAEVVVSEGQPCAAAPLSRRHHVQVRLGLGMVAAAAEAKKQELSADSLGGPGPKAGKRGVRADMRRRVALADLRRQRLEQQQQKQQQQQRCKPADSDEGLMVDDDVARLVLRSSGQEAQHNFTYSPPATSLSDCLRLLRPSPAVQSLLDREDWGRAARSFGVLAERRACSMLCPGCPSNLGTLANCSTRHIAEVFLRNTSAEFLVASVDPIDAVSIVDVFHESRAPFVSQATRDRVSLKCRPIIGDHTDAKADAAAAEDMFAEVRCARLFVADLFLLGATRGVIHSVPSSAAAFVAERNAMPLSQLLSMRSWRALPAPKYITPYAGTAAAQAAAASAAAAGTAAAAAAAAAAASGGAAAAESSAAAKTEEKGESVGGDTDGEEAEAFAKRPAFGPRCVCSSPVVRPLAQHPYMHNMVVDDELRMVYCQVEKAACTSIKMLLRSLKGLPNVTDYLATHVRKLSGFKLLDPDFAPSRSVPLQEADGINRMTRRDYMKVVFVRNPVDRILSAYLDKHAGVHSDAEPMNSAEWNKRMFGPTLAKAGYVKRDRVTPAWDVKLPFPAFVRLTAAAAQSGWHMDAHLANQTDLCRLRDIKYDFVGRLEFLDIHADSLLELLHNHTGKNTSEHRYVFGSGQKIHNTKAKSKLLNFYDAPTLGLVQKLYKIDFTNSLNNFSFQVPPALSRAFENAVSKS